MDRRTASAGLLGTLAASGTAALIGVTAIPTASPYFRVLLYTGWVAAGVGFIGLFALIIFPEKEKVSSGPPPVSAASPLVSQIDSLIDRLKKANRAHAADPDRFDKLSKYADLWVQVAELDHVGRAVLIAIQRRFGHGSKEEQLAKSAMAEEIRPYMPPDDDYFRPQINWLMRLRSVAVLLT